PSYLPRRRSPMSRGLLVGVGAELLVDACRPQSRSPTQPPTTPAATPLAFELQHPGTHIMLLHGQTRPGVARSNAAAVDNGIYYHGGPIIYAQKVAAIYWSNRTIYPVGPAPGTQDPGRGDGSLVGFFISYLGDRPYYLINPAYDH